MLQCDFTSLMSEVDRESVEALYAPGIALHWIYKRPDFRIFELMEKADTFYSS